MKRQGQNIFDLDKPSGFTKEDLRRDLEANKRILLRRGQPCMEVRAVGDKSERTLRFVCSTDGEKRDGNRVRNDGWNLEPFKKNPIGLWCHDSGSWMAPPDPEHMIANWFDEAIVDDGNGGKRLEMTARFATHDKAELIYKLYLPRSKGGDEILRAVSIGWTPDEYAALYENGEFVGYDFVKNTLLECSFVPIPADADALMVAAQRGVISSAQLEEFRNWQSRSRGHAYVLDHRAPVARASEGKPEEASDEGQDSTATQAGDAGQAATSGVPAEAASAGPGTVREALTALRAAIASRSDDEEKPSAADLLEDVQATLASLAEAVDALKAEVMGEADDAAEGDAGETGETGNEDQSASAAPTLERVGKKISKPRKDKLRQARGHCDEAIKRCSDAVRMVNEVLDEDPDDDDEAEGDDRGNGDGDSRSASDPLDSPDVLAAVDRLRATLAARKQRELAQRLSIGSRNLSATLASGRSQ